MPPQIPTMENTAASIGTEIKPAQSLGAITRRSGSTPIISILDSCSVVFINPISAVSAEPARPANSNAVTTGPNSRTRVRAIICPIAASDP